MPLNSRKTVFISDLHLEESEAQITHQFLQLLKRCTPNNTDALYILGDLFEVWIGDDDLTPFHLQIINALHHLTFQGVPIYFLHGNRDFLIGKKFARLTGCNILPFAEKINLYGTPLLLMHGDTLCTQDIAYLNARKKAYNPFLRFLFLVLPLKMRKRIADKMRKKSMHHTKTTAPYIMDVTQAEVVKIMQEKSVDYLIHGHTHRPGIHQFTLSQHPAKRIVLGAWHDLGHLLVWYESGDYSLLPLNEFLETVE